MKINVIVLSLLAALATGATDTTSFILPVNDTFFIGGEDVAFSGHIHLATRVVNTAIPTDPCTPVDPCRLNALMNLQRVSGLGLSTGRTYHVVGTARVETDTAVPAAFSIEGVGQIPPHPARLGAPPNLVRAVVSLSINAVGQVSVIDAHVEENVT